MYEHIKDVGQSYVFVCVFFRFSAAHSVEQLFAPITKEQNRKFVPFQILPNKYIQNLDDIGINQFLCACCFISLGLIKCGVD